MQVRDHKLYTTLANHFGDEFTAMSHHFHALLINDFYENMDGGMVEDEVEYADDVAMYLEEGRTFANFYEELARHFYKYGRINERMRRADHADIIIHI